MLRMLASGNVIIPRISFTVQNSNCSIQNCKSSLFPEISTPDPDISILNKKHSVLEWQEMKGENCKCENDREEKEQR